MADAELRSPQIAVARPLSGLASEPELEAWRAVLAEHGATAAFWFNVLLADAMELRYGIGAECAAPSFETIRDAPVSAWFGLWPINTPLWVHHLGSPFGFTNGREI